MHRTLFESAFFGAEGGFSPQAFIPIAAFVLIWLFLVILPSRKEKKKKEDMLTALKKGDEVLVQAGVLGKVQGVEKDVVVLECGGAKIRFLKSTVVRVIDKKSEEGAAAN